MNHFIAISNRVLMDINDIKRVIITPHRTAIRVIYNAAGTVCEIEVPMNDITPMFRELLTSRGMVLDTPDEPLPSINPIEG